MNCEDAKIVYNDCIKSDYYKIIFNAPGIVSSAQPGSLCMVQIAGLRDRILRRPFSVCDLNSDGLLTIVYKVAGEGTSILSELKSGTVCNLMGPLGNPYSLPASDELPVIAAGGYGSAAMYLIAKIRTRKARSF